MIFSPSIATLLCGAGILKGMGYTEATFAVAQATPSVVVSATIYSGVQPSAATIFSSWASYNTSFLFHQPSLTIIQPSWNSPTTGGILVLSGSPTAVTASNSGTASWAILWCSNVASGTGAGQISNATIPNANYIVGPVTLGSGKGIITMGDTNVVSGATVSILSASLSFTI